MMSTEPAPLSGPDDPRVRAADHRPRAQDQRAARAVDRDGRLLVRDPQARAEGAQAPEGSLRRAVGAAEGPARAAPGAAVHARLRRPADGRLRRAARRSQLPRRSGDRRRHGAVRRVGGPRARPPEGPQHQGEHAPQLRDGAARGLSQGDAPDAARVAVPPPDPVLHRHAGRVSRASAPRSAARPRRSPRRCR